jgi:uncharacterized protein YvpB
MSSFTVPFSSQYTDLGQHEWRARGCGIASLHMVLRYWHTLNQALQVPTLDELLRRGLAIGAYREKIGWTHVGLVNLAKEYGYNGFNVDVASNSPTPKKVDEAWHMLTQELSVGPVLASVYAGLDPARGGGHIVVVTGFHDGLVFFNDPEEMSEWEGRRMLALEVFLRAFKHRYIVVRPV